MTIDYGYVGYDVRFEMSVFMNLRFGSNASQNALNIRAFKSVRVDRCTGLVFCFLFFARYSAKTFKNGFMTLLTLDSR